MTEKLTPLDKFVVLDNDGTIAVASIVASDVMPRQGLSNQEYHKLLCYTMPDLTDWLNNLESILDTKMTFIERDAVLHYGNHGVSIGLYNKDDITAFLLTWTTK